MKIDEVFVERILRLPKKIDEVVVKRILRLRKGNRIEVNGKIFTIKKWEYHQSESADDFDATIFDLDDDFVLSIEWNQPKLYKVSKKKGWISETTRWRGVKINDIKIIK